MKHLLLAYTLFFFVSFHSYIAQAQNAQLWGGGYVVSNDKYPAVFRVDIGADGKKGRCTATLIGPRVILTAAHCAKAETGYFISQQTRYNFTFATYAQLFNEDLDLAIGIVEKDVVGVKPLSINFTDAVGKKAIALGYGCGIHNITENYIAIDGSFSKEIHYKSTNQEPVFACPGDSGGPTVAYNQDLKLQVISIHLRTDLKEFHMDLKTGSETFIDFVSRAVDTYKVQICDYNLECSS